MVSMTIPDLPETTILMVEVGSTAHGTGIAGGEDHDQLAIMVEAPEQVIGLDPAGFRTVMHRTQPEGVRSGPGDIDRTIHSLRRFVRLAASGNPSVLMALWAPIEFSTPLGLELRGIGEAFIGRHVVPRYRGYMQSQAKRLLGTGGESGEVRVGAGRAELVEAFGYDTKYAMHCARLGFQCVELLTTGALALPIQGEPADWLRAVRYGNVPFEEWCALWPWMESWMRWLWTSRSGKNPIVTLSTHGVLPPTDACGPRPSDRRVLGPSPSRQWTGIESVGVEPLAQRPQQQADRGCSDERLDRGPPAERAAGADERHDDLIARRASHGQERHESGPHRTSVIRGRAPSDRQNQTHQQRGDRPDHIIDGPRWNRAPEYWIGNEIGGDADGDGGHCAVAERPNPRVAGQGAKTFDHGTGR